LRDPQHISIIGGGIAGLATAYYLEQGARARGMALRCTLFDSAPRVGGKIVTERREGFVLEGGPDSFITQKPWGLELCRDLGLSDQLIPCNEAQQKVHILRQGRLLALPDGFRLVAPTQLKAFLTSPLFSARAKARILSEPLIRPRRDEEDESIAAFVLRRLGREAAEVIAGPLLAGIYVGDPEKLSLLATFPLFRDMEKKHGSLLRAVRAAQRARRLSRSHLPMFMSLREGMGSLVDALTATLSSEIRTCVTVQALRRAPGGEPGWTVVTDGGSLQSRAVVLAVPAFRAAEILSEVSPELSGRLRTIRYVTTATVSLAFRGESLTGAKLPPGFGFVVPKAENRRIIACTIASTKFAHRAPGRDLLIRAFVGGEGHEAYADLEDGELVQLVRSELAELIGIRAQPLYSALSRWPKGNPQYDTGHLGRVTEMERLAENLPGLHLAGSAYRGIGLPDCIRGAQEVAAKCFAADTEGIT